MSHASLLVALSTDELKAVNGDVQAAVTYQMEPFDEAGTWGADGSRWDWWVIGGRYKDRLTQGDVLLKNALDLSRIVVDRRVRFEKTWREAQSRPSNLREFLYDVKDDETLEDFINRSMPSAESCTVHYAYLRNRHWHECERLGMFGMSRMIECEIKAQENGNNDIETMIRRCKHTDPRTGARIIVWNEPFEIWTKEFYKRFIDPLPASTTLVTVDYHV